jgi:hypothetical protein
LREQSYDNLVILGRAEGANPESSNDNGPHVVHWIPGSPLRGAPE